MSGHSKWSTIKRKKSTADLKKGKVFTKLIKEITGAVKLYGPYPENNSRLRNAIIAAKAENMPKINIDKAIKKGSNLIGKLYKEIMYEGYAPEGVAVLLNVITDNRKRTIAEIRHIFTKYGGNLTENGSVSWIFSRKGFIIINKNIIKEDDLFNLVLELNLDIDDIKNEEFEYKIITKIINFEKIKNIFLDKKIKYKKSYITLIPNNYINLDKNKIVNVIEFLKELDSNEDIENIYTNLNLR